MGRRKELKYYNGRLQGSLDDETCQKLETLLSLKKENQGIESLTNTIYNLDAQAIADTINTGVVPEGALKQGSLTKAQTLGSAFMFYAKDCLLGDSVGLGKTVEICSLLNVTRKFKENNGLEFTGFKFLYLTEKSLVQQAQAELIKFTGQPVDLLYADKKSFLKYKEEHPEGITNGIVAPHSLFNQQELHSWLKDIRDGDEEFNYFDYLIVDESAVLSNTKTNIYKNAKILQQSCMHTILLNATPFDLSLDTMYGQISFIDDSFLPTKTAFQKEYYVMDFSRGYATPSGKYKNADKFKYLTSYRYFYQTRKQLGAKMNNVTTELLSIKLSTDQKRLMRESQMYKIIYDIPAVIDTSLETNEQTTPKLKLLKQVIDKNKANNEQIIIHAHFKESHYFIARWLKRQGINCDVLNGAVTDKDRAQVIKDFKENKTQVLITNVQKGLNFGAVKTIIFYGYPGNSSDMLQFEGRATRSFDIQDKKIYVLVTEGRELTEFKTKVAQNYKFASSFASQDISGIGQLLLEQLE